LHYSLRGKPLINEAITEAITIIITMAVTIKPNGDKSQDSIIDSISVMFLFIIHLLKTVSNTSHANHIK